MRYKALATNYCLNCLSIRFTAKWRRFDLASSSLILEFRKPGGPMTGLFVPLFPLLL